MDDIEMIVARAIREARRWMCRYRSAMYRVWVN